MKPTFCISLKIGSLIASIIDIIFSIFAFMVSIGVLAWFEIYKDDIIENFQHPPPDYTLKNFIHVEKLGTITIRVFLILNTIYWFQKIVVSCILFQGVLKGSHRLVRIWLIYTLALLILSILFFLVTICIGVSGWRVIPIYVFSFIMREISFWIINSFSKELESKKSCSSSYRSCKGSIDNIDFNIDMTLKSGD